MNAEIDFEKDPLIDTQEVARMVGSTSRAVRLWLQRGELPEPLRFRGRYRWRRSAILQWLQSSLRPAAK